MTEGIKNNIGQTEKKNQWIQMPLAWKHIKEKKEKDWREREEAYENFATVFKGQIFQAIKDQVRLENSKGI